MNPLHKLWHKMFEAAQTETSKMSNKSKASSNNSRHRKSISDQNDTVHTAKTPAKTTRQPMNKKGDLTDFKKLKYERIPKEESEINSARRTANID